MYSSPFSPHTMVHIMGSYQSNGQFLPLQNHGYYASNQANGHPEFNQFNRNGSNNNRRVTQHDYPQRYNNEAPGSGFGQHSRNLCPTAGEWTQCLNSPNHGSPAQQRQGLANTPIGSRPGYQRSTPECNSAKRNGWHGNKLGKRHSYQDLPQLRDCSSSSSCTNSDSGFSSRSPTPSKHYKETSPADSSDDHDSLHSASELRVKNRNQVKTGNGRGNLVTSLSTSNLYQAHRQKNESLDAATRNANQNNQNRRKYTAVRTSPGSHRQRGKKFNGSMMPEVPLCPKFYYSPADRFLEKSSFVEMKQKPQNLLTGSVYDKLSKAIWEKFEQNQLSYDTFCHKMYLWRYLFFFIKSRFPQYSLFMVGSTLNGFGSNVSDVDMCLLVRDASADQRYEAIYRLGQIMACLKRSDFITHLELIQAKVPILKIRDNVYNLDVDLNYNNVVGIRNTHLMYCYSQIDWRVRPLVIIVKMWAQCQNINDARHMTISSYSFALLVIHFLQCGINPPVLPCLHNIFKGKFHPFSDIHNIDIHEELNIPSDVFESRNSQTLGELLIEFFKYYDSFDYDHYAVSVRVAGRIPIETCRYVQSYKNDPHQWKFMCIEEPFDFTNTTRSVYDPLVFQKIKDVFKQTYQRLKKSNNLSSIFTKFDDSL